MRSLLLPKTFLRYVQCRIEFKGEWNLILREKIIQLRPNNNVRTADSLEITDFIIATD